MTGAAVTTPALSQGYNIDVLVSFGANGFTPEAGLLRDSAGDLYGTTGGGAGTAFELTFRKRKWNFRTIYTFCKENICRHGVGTASALIEDTAGNLYGTAPYGGLADSGTVFELTPNANGNRWTLTLLHDFCTRGNCPDGQYPYAGLTYAGASSGLPYDGVSPLYGVTEEGGAEGDGAVYEVVPSKHGGKWSESVLYSFCSQDNCADGSYPEEALILDASGNLYGVTPEGGANNDGTVFELNKPAGKQWSEAVLYSFCSQNSCTDGVDPGAALLMDTSGNLYGTTTAGGSANKGIAYELAPDQGQWMLAVLYTFCSLKDCADGDGPVSPLIADGSGDLYGMTETGGANDGGTTFQLVPNGTQSQLTVLYSFCSQAHCADGEYPPLGAGLVMDGSGDLFGTTENGGGTDDGIAFELTPP